MSLNSLQIALQGLYQLTPVAMAVQGLIALLVDEEEKRQQVYGSGKQAAAAPVQPKRQAETDDDIARLVREKWEAIESRDKQEQYLADRARVATVKIANTGDTKPIALDAQDTAPAAAPAVAIEPMPVLVDPVDDLADQRIHRDFDDEEALILLLAEL